MFGIGKNKKDKQFGETLGALSIKHATDEQAVDFMEKNKITAEKDRILLSLSILNTSLATVAVNSAMNLDNKRINNLMQKLLN